MMEQLFTRVIGYQPIEFVHGLKANGAFYPKDHPIPSLTDRQAMWNGAGLPPTDTPFEIELPAGFNFGKYIWGKHGAEWDAIQKAGRFHDELRFTWAYKHAIPDGHPFVGDVSHAGVAKVPRVLVLGYVIDPDSDFGIWNDDLMTFWRMLACWWAGFCLGKDISLWEFLSGWKPDRDLGVMEGMTPEEFYPWVASLKPFEVSSSGKHIDHAQQILPANKRRLLGNGGFVEVEM